MISKSKNLIALFTVLFLFLLGIQAYFTYKTYQLREREIYRTIHKRLTPYTDRLEDKGGVKKIPNQSLQQIFIKYNNKEISKKEFLDFFTTNRKNVEKQFSQYVDNEFKKEGYIIAVKIEYKSITFVPTKTNLIDQPIIVYETENKVTEPGSTNTGTWETSSKSVSDDLPKIERNNTFFLKSQTSYQILNIKNIVFKDLALLILCCIAILSSVLILYIFTVKNLIRQQRQVEILHTVVDNISHEFKTPIATLKIASKALKKNLNPETLPLIDRQITRLENLMSQLHEDETEEEISTTKPEDWDFFIEDLIFTYSEIQFDLKNEISQELPFDKNLMETMVKNLCENSVKYGASIVKVKITQPLHHLEIEVSDNGQGMEKKELKSIFEKFYRIQSNNIHNTKGLGLGLYFIQKIIKKYNGKIEVASKLKEGTTFKIQMPYEN
ncbi:sensor histidine kinase [Chryseobacterium paludis]|uniref:sensor histidine kinase n=1 Tax=Chryseobacterium paludis TaxID=2956784 RepID=UPI0021BFF11E|nr:HAMP domain-containing sensor histidine kinase [Chryseobacterium paludis]